MVTTTLATSMAAACGASASGSPRLARRARARGTPVNTGARSARKPRTTVWSMGGDDKEKSDTLGNLDAMLGTSQEEEQPPAAPQTPKEVEDGVFIRKEMSKAQQDKLRKEYLSFGGGPNTAMGANYYLYIIVIISALAVAAKLSGAF